MGCGQRYASLVGRFPWVVLLLLWATVAGTLAAIAVGFGLPAIDIDILSACFSAPGAWRWEFQGRAR